LVIGSANLTGTKLGNYQLQALLGTGGMASVYRGFDQNLRRPVAIKVLSEAAAAQPGFVERFRQEALLLARLRHPHIVQVYDFGEQDGAIYMVQELLPGPTLEQRLRDLAARGEKLDRQETLAIVAQLASALDAAHAAGIIHRDVKPGNAIWNASGALVLTDFGIAKSTLLPHGHTQTGMVIGTPDYISPEQAQGLPLTPASDIYSLGAVLYQLLSGKAPFGHDTPMRVVISHIQSPPPQLQSLRPDLPPAVEAVVQRSMAKDPAARFSSAGELSRALEHAWTTVPPPAAGVHDQPTRVWDGAASARSAARPSAPQPVPQPAPRIQPAQQIAAPVSPTRRRPRSALPLVMALLLLGGIALAARGAWQLVATAPSAVPVVSVPAPTAEPPTPQPTAEPPTPQPTAEPPTPQPTAEPPSPQPTAEPPSPQPTVEPAPAADSFDQLRALLKAGRDDGRAGKDGNELIQALDKARQALADDNKKRAADRLHDMRKRLVDGVNEDRIDPDFAKQVLSDIDSIAETYGLKLPPIKD
jgi:eukaryotic-like serine/threonine-protein kinase